MSRASELKGEYWNKSCVTYSMLLDVTNPALSANLTRMYYYNNSIAETINTFKRYMMP